MYDAYEAYKQLTVSNLSDSPGYIVQQESMENYILDSGMQSKMAQSSMSSRPRNSEDPWNQLEAHRTLYTPGYAVYMPSPGPVGKQDPEEILKGTRPPEVQQASKGTIVKRTSHSNREATKQGTGLTWAHYGVENGDLQAVGDNLGGKSGPRVQGRRNGPLEHVVAEKARIIRLGPHACWRCWKLKVSVRSILARFQI